MEGWRKKCREEGSAVLSEPALSGRPLSWIYTSDPEAFICAQRKRWSHAAGRYTLKNKAGMAGWHKKGMCGRVL